jgi:hypothetical protein
MDTIGTIAFVQIQRAPMKRGEGAQRAYNPEPLLRVAKLRLTWQGVIGVTDSGENIIDAHNALHLSTRHNGTGENGISVGFLRHYDSMRAEFGAHVVDGIAGENIIVESATPITPELLGERVGIRSAADGSVIELVNVFPAPPCEPFSRFCAVQPIGGAEMKRVLQFLDHGTRGYYASMSNRDTIGVIAAGDTLVRLA